jgi:hypothetical protein
MPKALTAMMETEPTVEQIERYMRGFLRPYLGETLYIMTVEKTATIAQ